MDFGLRKFFLVSLFTRSLAAVAGITGKRDPTFSTGNGQKGKHNWEVEAKVAERHVHPKYRHGRTSRFPAKTNELSTGDHDQI